MNAPSVDIKDIIEAQSALGLTFATNLFIGSEPNTPDNCVTIFDTIGANPNYTLDGASGLQEPSVQIRVRNNSYLTGWALVQQLFTTFHTRAQETWNGTLYSIIYVASGPAMLDWDENNRVRFILNINLQRR